MSWVLRGMAWGLMTGLVSASAYAFEVGDFVFPKTTPGKIKVGDAVVTEVAITDYLKVEKAEGDWLWVECRDLLAPGDEGKKGWIGAATVDDLETQIRYFEGKARESNNAAQFFLAGIVAALPDDADHQRRAVALISRAIELDGSIAYYYQRRASCYALLGEYDPSIRDLQRAQQLDPANESIPKLIEMVRGFQGSGAGPAPPLPVTPPTEPVVQNDSPAPPSGGGGGAASTGQPDQRVRTALLGTDLQFTVTSEGNFKLILNVGNGRTQALVVNSTIETLGDMEIREIWSAIGKTKDKTFNAQISDRLLRIGSIKKVGAVQVIALDGELLAYYCAKVPAELSPEQMETLVNTVAYIADDAENTLFGGDEY